VKFIIIGRGTSGWFIIYMGDGVEDGYVIAHDKVKGQ